MQALQNQAAEQQAHDQIFQQLRKGIVINGD
jgi:hypothetical protein